jgi:hypothetical protein
MNSSIFHFFLHVGIPQMIVLFVTIGVRTSNPESSSSLPNDINYCYIKSCLISIQCLNWREANRANSSGKTYGIREVYGSNLDQDTTSRLRFAVTLLGPFREAEEIAPAAHFHILTLHLRPPSPLLRSHFLSFSS